MYVQNLVRQPRSHDPLYIGNINMKVFMCSEMCLCKYLGIDIRQYMH
jgi:hypothetical protein